MRFPLFAAVAGCAISGSAVALDVVMTPQGYSGVGLTPSARLLDWGLLDLAYDRQVPGGPTRGRISGTEGHNYVAGFGFLPNLEISGRIAANANNTNCYVEACGARDLSPNVKAGFSFGTRDQFRVAVGATDVGGNVNYFRSYYGVGTYSIGTLDLSLGGAKRSGAGILGSQSVLNGIFASAVYQPFPWLQGYVEYSDTNAWTGARVFAPQQWTPQGWKAHVGFNVRLNENALTQRSWFGVGISIPLGKISPLRAFSAESRVGSQPQQGATSDQAAVAAIPLPSQTSVSEVVPSDGALMPGLPPPVTYPAPEPVLPRARMAVVSDGDLVSLSERLKGKGFEDISVGRLANGAIAISVNNAVYNHNVLDALGVALGVVGRSLGTVNSGYALVLNQRQTAIVGVAGQTDCLKRWIDAIRGGGCEAGAGELYTPGGKDLKSAFAGVAWVVDSSAPSWHTMRIGLQPVLKTTIATEYGVLDYSAALGINFQQPLWSGATAELRYIAPVDNSTDFKANKVFGDDRLRSGVDRALLTQTLRIPVERWLPGVSARNAENWGLQAIQAYGAVGKVSNDYDGVYGELRWEPGDGAHRFGLEGGRFSRSYAIAGPIYGPVTPGAPRIAEPVLGSYRYAYSPTQTSLEMLGGRFMNNDKGVQVALRQWFSDTSVAIYLKRTKFDFEKSAVTFVGLELSLPLGPRKDMSPGSLFQVTGTARWAYGVETIASGTNFLTSAHAVRPGLAALNATFNSDRSGLQYFSENMRRIREAAQ